MATDYPDWGALAALQTFITNLNLASQTLQATAAEIAAEIAATGVPLLGNPVALYNATVISVPAATTGQNIDNESSGTVTAMGSYLSYDVCIAAECNASSTVPFLVFDLIWYVSSSGDNVSYAERWIVPASSSGATLFIYGTGPVHGAYLQIQVSNHDPSYAATIEKILLYGNSRPSPEPRPDWRCEYAGNTVPGYTIPQQGANRDGVLGYWAGTLAADATATLLCGLYNGQVALSAGVSGTSPDLQVTPQGYLQGTSVVDVWQQYQVGTEADQFSTLLYVPRTPLILALSNQNASDSVTYNLQVVAAPM